MSAQQHALEYAKSGRAKCHGACGGSLIPQATLRYGRKFVSEEYGETIKWRHWHPCVTEQILVQLASVRLDQVPGFRSLRVDDQNRIRQDVKTRRTSPDQPANSQAAPSRKRKAEPLSQNRDDDFDEYFDNAEDDVKDELYVSLPTNVVGVQYYRGMVGPGEEVLLVREPHNKYDSNAIQVLNISRTQVGHIGRNVSSKLAPLIDRNHVTVEGARALLISVSDAELAQGVIHEGNLNKFEYAISMTLKIYGASHKREQLEPLLIWATPKQKGFTNAMRPTGYQSQNAGSTSNYPHIMPPPSTSQAGPSRSQPTSGVSHAQRKAQEERAEALRKAAELRSVLSSLEKVDDEGRRSSLLDSVCTTDDMLNLPVHPSPPSVASGDLMVDLLKHQSQALQWCLERETPSLPRKESDKPVQFWQYRTTPGRPNGYYLNLATKTPQEDPPVMGRGGLMADAMGLGKTLTMLALIVATKKDIPADYSNTTLIVVPLSVLSNWSTQISEHCTFGTLSAHVYYDAGRNVAPEHLTRFDVVITTYQVVAGDFNSHNGIKTKVDQDGKSNKKKKSNGGLFNIKWKRVILDEAHTVRNPKTKMSTAVRGLEAQRRWAVTGTPIINSPRDLGSLIQFLQICRPLDKEDFYKRLVLRPLAQGTPEGAELLRALMSQICIRRTKEMQNSEGEHLVPLPGVEMTQIPVALDAATRELYDEVETLTRQKFATYIERQGSSGGVSVPTNVLSLVTRLRQLALHPGLLPSNYLEQLRSLPEDSDKSAPAIQITPQDRIRLQSLLLQAIEDNEECPICFNIPSDPRITACAHMYCLPCISEIILRDPRCPMDRRIISTRDLIEPPPPTDLTQAPVQLAEEEDASGIRAGSSAKIEQLVHLLQLTPRTEKSLVFSQFTGFLDKIAEALEKQGIPYVRFDGQMSARKRQEVLERFGIPLEESPATQDSTMPAKRSRHSSTRVVAYEDDFDAKDGDFDIGATSDDDDSFVSEDDSVWTTKKGKGKAKAKAKTASKRKSSTFAEHVLNPVVMLISLKAGALGLNLTVANNVYLMDPWWQEGIESQAIDRCNRIGQMKPVHVYQLVAENTVEAKVLEIQEKKKALIKQAFSGIKTTETQRQKKEARLQDLIELFGVRREAVDKKGVGAAAGAV